MSIPVPESWLASPPGILVAGDGPYAAALALILGGGLVGCEELQTEPTALSGTYPLVLDGLRLVFLVAGQYHGAADLLAAHAGVWRWMDRLSQDRGEHPLAVIFVLPPEAGEGFISSLTLALALPGFDPTASGHAVVRMGEPLETLLITASQTIPKDAVILRNRIEADRRHGVLRRLREAAMETSGGGDSGPLRSAASAVLETFAGREYDLDLFCRPPRHPNGNAVRGLLHQFVTGEVTPSSRKEVLTRLT